MEVPQQVPVYGTLFFSTGQTQWPEKYPLPWNKTQMAPLSHGACRLAKYYGFDGYFINRNNLKLVARWKNAIHALYEYAAKVQPPDQMLGDAMT